MTLPKSEWGPGPWQDEPDELTWVDEATQLVCHIHREDTAGTLCGYVAAPFRISSDEAEKLFDVHGGISWTEWTGSDSRRRSSWSPALVIAFWLHTVGQRTDAVTWLGFDTGHFMDSMPAMRAKVREAARLSGKPDPYEEDMAARMHPDVYRDMAYVKRECERLAQQVKEACASK